MHASTLQGVLDHLRELTDPSRAAELSDADLLERFRLRREEAAFTLLVQRHGPMVLAVCRRILGDVHESEDAFQATFLVLVRNAAAIRKRQSLAAWLHGVAARIAHKARTRSARQQTQRQVGPTSQPDFLDDPSETLAAKELRSVLDEEIARLPEKYRTPLALCYLADRTHEQAAGELGWPKSSVTARLARARELLQRRLLHRGITVPAGLLAVLLTETTANAAVPSLLTLSTGRLAVQALAGETLSTTVAVLADGVVKGAATAKYAAMLTLVASLGFAAALGNWMTSPPVPSAQHKKQPQAIDDRGRKQVQMPKPRVDLFGDPLPPGARARLGTVRLRLAGNISQYAFSPDGKVLAAAGSDSLNTVCLWDVATGRELRRLERAGGEGVAFSPGGEVLAVGSPRGVRRWDTATWKELPRWSVKSDGGGKLFFSPDGRALVCIGDKRPDNQTFVNTVVFLDTSTGRELHHLDGRKNYVAPSIAFAPDSKTWAYVDRHDETIPLYDVRTGKEVRRLKGHSCAAQTITFSPDGKTLASTDFRGTLRFWETATGKLLAHQGKFDVRSLAYFPDGKTLLGWGSVPIRYDIAARKIIPTPGPRWIGESTVLLSPDGTWLAWANDQHVLHLWDAVAFKPIQPITTHEREVWAVAFSPDGNTVVSAAVENGFVRRWNTATGQPLPPFGGVRDFVYALAYSPDGKTLAVGTGNQQGAIWLLDSATGRRLRTLVVPHGSIVSLAFSADGRTLLSGLNTEICLWDMTAGKVRQTLPGGVFPCAPRVLALSPDGQVLADASGAGSRCTIQLREAATGKEIHTLQDRDNLEIYALVFRPDGKTLASGGHDRSVKLWDVETGRLLWRVKRQQGGIVFLAFSPDGKTLVSGDGEGGVCLWETATGNERGHFGKHRYGVRSGAFSRDGKLLATGGYDTTILIWDLAAAAGPPRQSPLSVKELDALWADLAERDATKAFQAIHRLAASPKQTLPFLCQHLKPVPAQDTKCVRQLVDKLDSADFPTRQNAAEELEKQADSIVGLMRQIMAKERPSLEVRRRLQQILESIEHKPESLRAVRAIEVLEWIGTADAARFLDELARGAAEARLTREASDAKRRLRR